MKDTEVSLESAFRLRGKAFAEIREHTAAIDRLATATANLDVCLQSSIDQRSIDEMQGLVVAVRLLAAILDGGQA